MLTRIQLTRQERTIVERVKREGWRSRLDNWTVARLALARSLQMPDAPPRETYLVISAQQGGIELHAPQLTGEGKGSRQDFTDIYCAMLSIYESTDLFADEDAFHEALQRHVRRGLTAIDAEWHTGSDLNRYILDEIMIGTGELDPERSESDFVDRVTRVLGQIGASAKLLNSHAGPRLTRLTYELGQLEDLDRVRKGIGKLGFALGLGEAMVSMSLGSAAQTVLLDIPRPSTSWTTVEWATLKSSIDGPVAQKMRLPIVVGTDVVGNPLIFDLAEAPHLFVGGTTGSGKSVCLHTILLSLLHDRSNAPELLLVDPKTVEFAGYRDLPNLRTGAPVTSADAAVVALEDLVQEMDRRQDVIGGVGAKDIDEANSKGAALRRIVAVVDELGDLFMTRPEIELPLIRLAQKARSAGIHLVLATQRPEAATFPGMLRSNVPSRIALTVQKASESRIILDEGGAEQLLGRGDMLVRFTGRPLVRGHGARVLPTDIATAVRH
ncbi:FtsK/SpoIIIE domain-containing protein [Mesorhizobium sp. M0053]|uniref:FtsK/SpoIIIE domain-containing protein n=1 Tax=Mesorhizobium sp. M0053 TaxID=2956864 RepID=UPI00333C69BB